ncbi:helix-turn-helix transcriptional regulator [Verrucosispora sp. WMMA2044]|uniref:helix-turn-helix domain-containing protein n=1 Tax=Verrucosispora sp. WMMA2044 TaxID=3016419 RepID=UPI00248B3A80|nr:helix-turn-helix transcriptional regulator [Verrucosispora sp. WMMA2044]WBB51351.1 helix-turn-helix transcriptional regulator [Verrucosispora sp. WMMA2044]
MSSGELPIGRRVARWRVRRGMTQQMLADRLGKSKSWVDKVERGARRLDRYPTIQQIGDVLRVDPMVLLGQRRPPRQQDAGTPDGVDGIRAALARYDRALGDPVSPVEVRRQVEHAWLSFQHAHYAPLVRALPGLLDAAHASPARELLVPAYRITASVLVKLGEADLGWLAADRAMGAAGGDALLSAAAAVSVGQALRALGRHRLALAMTDAAASHLGQHHAAVQGTLLLEGALAAAGCGEARRAAELTGCAAGLAAKVREDTQRTGFGPAAVELARVVATIELGDAGAAVHGHSVVMRRDGWRRLPAEHRGAYLVDVARAYLQIGDLRGAARALVDADAIAPAEIRCRPLARTVIADLAHRHPAPAGVARLATLVGLTR